MAEQSTLEHRVELLHEIRFFLVQAFRYLPHEKPVRMAADETLKAIDTITGDYEALIGLRANEVSDGK